MFEYVSEKKHLDKEEIKGKVLTAVITLASAAGLFAVLYWAASGV
jgi:hypothetical protein